MKLLHDQFISSEAELAKGVSSLISLGISGYKNDIEEN